MKILLKPAIAAGLALASASAFAATPAPATGPVVKGIGVIDPAVIVSGSTAFKTAETQRPVTYKQYYDQAQTRGDQIQAQLKPLYDKFDADRKAATPNTADLQKQYATIQQMQQQGRQELNQILQPVGLSQAYVEEQIQDVLPKAVENAATKKGVTLILNRDGGGVVMRDPAYNMNDEVTAELNALLPTAQLSPPPGWLPREERERQAQAQAASGQSAPAAAAPGTAPAGAPADSR
ncbi:MAG: OmpH family outer membrane protein [Candidatus Andeanibacterium colombiense]|uniref:OmpH family outer membrane protein n=1 Tax=Candidatus Andeanibacterium colombiense TaxID=3121345 RepID=A0AAJ6BN54_9SPHN|nr:MAG: OmpH family outer membrane protein [Sphingomonadaceae bacterium]